jgi:catechol 2,3-dioxygenase-like lactoylglutathione lyase family enzyme
MAQAIGKLNSITLAVADMNRSVKFYRDVLGFKVDYKSAGWSELKIGNFYLGLYEEKPKKSAGGPLPVLEVTNIKKTVADLKKKKVKFREGLYEEDYGWLAIFTDPDGYQYELFQEK